MRLRKVTPRIASGANRSGFSLNTISFGFLHRLKRLCEIGDKIIRVFYSYRNADEIVGDTQLLPPFIRHAQMRHRCRVGC